MADGGGGGGSDDDDDDDGGGGDYYYYYYYYKVPADRDVTANTPDMVIKNIKEKTCILVNVAILADRNVVQKEAEKKKKYKSLLCMEIQ